MHPPTEGPGVSSVVSDMCFIYFSKAVAPARVALCTNYLIRLVLILTVAGILPVASSGAQDAQPDAPRELTLARVENWLVIRGAHLPEGEIRINYLEAYCRAGSTDRDWEKTVVGHSTELLSLSPDRKVMKLRCLVKDGITVHHTITAGDGHVAFELTAHNPTASTSVTHWAQPCIRLGAFTGYDDRGKDLDDYLPRCFIFLDGKLTLMHQVRPWSKEARYVPGQVWVPSGVPRTDVNPRPLSPLIPSNGLIGCFSGDESQLFAVAFEPWQELFQGVARCLHSDFRIGGLAAGETRTVKGRIYIMRNDVQALLAAYKREFPGQ